MNTAEVKALKAEHKLASVSDRAHCTCGWVSLTRVGVKSAARGVHNDHVREVVAEVERVELVVALAKVDALTARGRASVRVDAELLAALKVVRAAAATTLTRS